MDKHLTASAKKFLFDLNDFDEAAIRRREALARRPTFSQEELAAAAETGFTEGRIEGMKEAIGSQEAQIRDLMQQIVIAADRLKHEEADRMATFIDQSVLIAVQALGRALPRLLDIMAIDQIAGFVTGVMEQQVKGQTIAIYTSPAREAEVRDRLDAMAQTMHRKVSWTIAADPRLHDLQCRMEWTGGGAEWDPAAVSDGILQAIMSHLPEHLRGQAVMAPPASMDAAPETEHTEPQITDAGDGS